MFHLIYHPSDFPLAFVNYSKIFVAAVDIGGSSLGTTNNGEVFVGRRMQKTLTAINGFDYVFDRFSLLRRYVGFQRGQG